MSRTITAMFDSRADAEAGRQRLLDAHIDADNVRIHDQASAGGSDQGYSTHQEPGVWSSLKNAFLPDEDRHTYEEGMRRGGFLLTADVDEGGADQAVRVLEGANTVDMDERAGQWKLQGWDYPAGAGTASAGMTSAATRSADLGRDSSRIDGKGGEERLDIVEERLEVGKREVERGNVRVRSYVTEKPVHEQIRLRQEKVSVERHPVDRKINAGDDAFRDRTIEMSETSEEAVIGKTARVVEEVFVRKTGSDRVEDINETVRRTEVDVDDLSGSDRSRTGTLDTNYDNDRTGATTGAASTAAGVSNTAGGLGEEALGNVNQGLGSLTGNEDLKRSGEAQERAGEQKQGKRPD